MQIDIICPLYNAEKYIDKLQNSIEMQEDVEILNIRYIITKGKDNTEILVENIKNNNKKVIYKVIDYKEFSHSLTREKEAFESNADIIVFITQDIKIERKDWLYNLIKPIEHNECDACYSRQICKDNSIEKYTRENNYPENSKIISKNDINILGLKTFFFSDASSAIKRKTFIDLGGYDKKAFPTNEDMYIAYKLIMNDYKIKYCADSEIVHSHTFTLKQQYKRYYDIGKFFAQNSYLNAYKVNKTGGSMAKYIFKRAIKDKNWIVLLKFIPNMLARFIGMKVGKYENRKYYNNK